MADIVPSPEQTYGVGHMLMFFLSVDVTGAQRGKAGLLRAHRQDLNTFLSDSKATGPHYSELRDATFRLPLGPQGLCDLGKITFLLRIFERSLVGKPSSFSSKLRHLRHFL